MLTRRLLWFVALWVVAVGALALVVRWVVPG
jgi:hypothetical protein